MTKRKTSEVQNFKKSKKLKTAERTLPCKKLIDLPTEVLEQIIGGMSLYHQTSLRCTCKRLKEVTDGITWNEVQVALHQFKKDPITYQKYSALEVLHLATRPFQKAGFFSLFLRLAQLVMNDYFSCQYLTPYHLRFTQLSSYLLSFLSVVNDRFPDTHSQESKMQYVTALLGILQNAPNCTLVQDTRIDSRHLELVYKVKGFIKALNREQCPELDRNTVLIALAELMVNRRIPFSDVYWTMQGALIVGKYNELETSPNITFIFLIQATESLLDYFRKIPKELENLPTDPFEIVLKIVC